MANPIELRTDGPHSPEYTRDVADLIAEGVRVLNYATSGRDGAGLDYPSDVYSLLGALYTATARLPQLFSQLGAFLKHEDAPGRLGEDHGRDPAERIAVACSALGAAEHLAVSMTTDLQRAQQAIAGLYLRESTDG